MTVTAPENYAADEYFSAEDPPEDGAEDVSAGQEAPYGWTRDKETNELRPKKRPGRPKNPPSAEEVAAAAPLQRDEDKPPTPGQGKPSPAEVPMPKGGVIAKGVDRLYRRAGKILRIADDDLGRAVIECTRPDPDDPDAPTVGQAWEALARDNPRVRAWLLRLIRGGAWQDLLMAHAPIGIALMTKDWVQRLVPFHRAAEVLFEEDEDTGPSDLRTADVADMQRTAEQQAHKIAARMGVKVPRGVAEAAMRQAEAMAADGRLTPPYTEHDLPDSEADGVPPGLRRQQPRNRSRAARRK